MNVCTLVRQSDFDGDGGWFVTHPNMEVVKFKVWPVWDFNAEKSDEVNGTQIADEQRSTLVCGPFTVSLWLPLKALCTAVSSLRLCPLGQRSQVIGVFQKWKINKTKRQRNKTTGPLSVPPNWMNASIKQYKTAKSYFLPAQSALTCKTGFSFCGSLKGGSWCFWLRYPRWMIYIQSEELLWVWGGGGGWTEMYLVCHCTQTCTSLHTRTRTHTPDSCTLNLPSSL